MRGDVAPIRLLVIALQGLGSALMTTPLFAALKAKGAPAFHVTALVQRFGSGPVMEANPHVDEVLLVEQQQSLWDNLRLLWALRQRRFDVAVVSWPGGIRSVLLAYLSGAPKRLGHPPFTLFFRLVPWLYTDPLPIQQMRHDVDQNLDLAEALGAPASFTDLYFPLKPEARAFAEHVLADAGLEGSLLIGFHPGSSPSMTYKRWPAERFVELGDLVEQRLGGKVILFGGPDERPFLHAIADRMQTTPPVMAYDELPRRAAVLERCAAMVSNDTAWMHLAETLGVPTVAIFGPTLPELTGPYEPMHRVVKGEHTCGPHFRFHGGFTPCATLDCLRGITTERVFTELAQLLQETSGR